MVQIKAMKITKMTVAEYAKDEKITRQAVYYRKNHGLLVFQPATEFRPLMIVTNYK